MTNDNRWTFSIQQKDGAAQMVELDEPLATSLILALATMNERGSAVISLPYLRLSRTETDGLLLQLSPGWGDD